MLQTKYFFCRLNLFKIPFPNLLGWLTYLGSTTRKWTHYSMLKSILGLKKNDDILNNMVLVSFKRIPLSDLISNTGFSIASVLGTKKKSQKNLVIYNKILKRDYSIFISNTCRSTTRLCKKFIGISVHKRFVGGSGIKKGAETLGKALGENAGVIAPISTHTPNISSKAVEKPPTAQSAPSSTQGTKPQKISQSTQNTPASKKPEPLQKKNKQDNQDKQDNKEKYETTTADLPKISLEEAIELVKKPLYPIENTNMHETLIQLAKDMPLKKKPIDTPPEIAQPQTGPKEQLIGEPINSNHSNDILDGSISSLPLPLPIPLPPAIPPAVVPPPSLPPSPQIKSFQKSINEELKDLFKKNSTEDENEQNVHETNNQEQIEEKNSSNTYKEVLEELRKRKLLKDDDKEDALTARAYSLLPPNEAPRVPVDIQPIPADLSANPFYIGLLEVTDDNTLLLKGIHTHVTLLYADIDGKTILWGYLTSKKENNTELSTYQPFTFTDEQKKQYLCLLQEPLVVDKKYIKDMPTCLKADIIASGKNLIDNKLPNIINQQNSGMEYISQPEIKHKLITEFNEKTLINIKKHKDMLPIYEGHGFMVQEVGKLIVNADAASEKRAEEDFKKYIQYKNQTKSASITKMENHMKIEDPTAYQLYLLKKNKHEK